MTANTDFDGDQCVVLPENYLQSAKAASEIYEDDLASVATNLEVDNLSKAPGFFHGTLIATLLFMLPSIWMACC